MNSWRGSRGLRRRCGSMAFSPDGRTLAAGHEDRCVRLWDVATGEISRRSKAIPARSPGVLLP